MKYSVSPVVRVAVDVVNAQDLPKLMEGLKRLAKSDPLVLCYTAPTGEHIVAGAGELHLEICLKDLRDDFMKNAPIKTGNPVVSFSETVTDKGDFVSVGKSPNKHNRFYLRAEPVGDKFIELVEKGDITMEMEMKTRVKELTEKCDWDVTDASKIWAMGPQTDCIANVLVDTTKAVQYLNEIKDGTVGAWNECVREGVLCRETLRGVRINIEDVVLHSDTIHRTGLQISTPFNRAIKCAQLKNGPAIMEPLYLCDIVVPQNNVSGVYSTLNARRGVVDSKEDRQGTPLCKVKAYLPVLESFGFTSLLRQNTGGQAFPQMIFSHWAVLPGNPIDGKSKACTVLLDVRKRKGMKDELPDWNEYYDKV